MSVDDIFDVSMEKVENAALKYNATGYNFSYMQVYKADLREKLIADPDEDSVRKLIHFVNTWKNRTRYSILPDLHCVLRSSVERNLSLRGITIEDAEVSDLEVVQCVFDELRSVKYFGPTGASKFLGVIHPKLCAMWDNPIVKALGHKVTDPNYSEFLQQMKKLALKVREDSEKNRITDPAKHISQQLKFCPAFTLVTLINHYLWVRISLPLRKEQH